MFRPQASTIAIVEAVAESGTDRDSDLENAVLGPSGIVYAV